MTKKYKFWTGVLALLPVFLMIVFAIYMFSVIFYSVRLQSQGLESDDAVWPVVGIFVAGILLFVSGIASFIFYLLHVTNNKSLDSTENVVWILMVLFATIIAIPIYWYMKIYKSGNNVQPPART